MENNLRSEKVNCCSAKKNHRYQIQRHLVFQCLLRTFFGATEQDLPWLSRICAIPRKGFQGFSSVQ